MKGDIELFEMAHDNKPIGTEVLDGNLPSNIEFPEQEKLEHQRINPQIQPSPLKRQQLGEQIKSYKIKGTAVLKPAPLYQKGSLVNHYLPTLEVKCIDEESGNGLKKIWDSLVGYSKREAYFLDGHLYIMEKKREGLVVTQSIALGNLFKIFVDSEEEKVRLVIKEGERLVNKDLQPANYLRFIDSLGSQISKIGLTILE